MASKMKKRPRGGDEFPVGSYVTANFRGLGQYYPGRVLAADAATASYTVRYEDGATEAGMLHAWMARAPRDRRSDDGDTPAALVCQACHSTNQALSEEGGYTVECDHCRVVVHEECYGMAAPCIKKPDAARKQAAERWYCQRCTAARAAGGVPAPAEYKCALCPNVGASCGPLVALPAELRAPEPWAHVVCAQYIPHLWVEWDKSQLGCGVVRGWEGPASLAEWCVVPCEVCALTYGMTAPCPVSPMDAHFSVDAKTGRMTLRPAGGGGGGGGGGGDAASAAWSPHRWFATEAALVELTGGERAAAAHPRARLAEVLGKFLDCYCFTFMHATCGQAAGLYEQFQLEDSGSDGEGGPVAAARAAQRKSAHMLCIHHTRKRTALAYSLQATADTPPLPPAVQQHVLDALSPTNPQAAELLDLVASHRLPLPHLLDSFNDSMVWYGEYQLRLEAAAAARAAGGGGGGGDSSVTGSGSGAAARAATSKAPRAGGGSTAGAAAESPKARGGGGKAAAAAALDAAAAPPTSPPAAKRLKKSHDEPPAPSPLLATAGAAGVPRITARLSPPPSPAAQPALDSPRLPDGSAAGAVPFVVWQAQMVPVPAWATRLAQAAALPPSFPDEAEGGAAAAGVGAAGSDASDPLTLRLLQRVQQAAAMRALQAPQPPAPSASSAAAAAASGGARASASGSRKPPSAATARAAATFADRTPLDALLLRALRGLDASWGPGAPDPAGGDKLALLQSAAATALHCVQLRAPPPGGYGAAGPAAGEAQLLARLADGLAAALLDEKVAMALLLGTTPVALVASAVADAACEAGVPPRGGAGAEGGEAW